MAHPSPALGPLRSCALSFVTLPHHIALSIFTSDCLESNELRLDGHVGRLLLVTMINAFLVFNGQGQPRLAKFYTQLVGVRECHREELFH